MLTERIIKIIVFIGDVQRMTGQVAQRDDFIAAFQQQFRDTHVQDGVGNAVVAGDEHQHFIVRSQSRSNTGLSRVMPLLSMSRALAMDAAAVCI